MNAMLTGAESREAAVDNVGRDATSALEQATSVFLETRPQLIEIARRIVRTSTEAEDVVQEAWLRWQGTDRSVVRQPPAFLATTTTRLAINLVQSARSRREICSDPEVLEPADPGMSPEGRAVQNEAVEGALALLQRDLRPAERSAYVLREAFDYPYEEIAAILLLTTAHTRQLVRRARGRLEANQRMPVSTDVPVTTA